MTGIVSARRNHGSGRLVISFTSDVGSGADDAFDRSEVLQLRLIKKIIIHPPEGYPNLNIRSSFRFSPRRRRPMEDLMHMYQI